MTASMSNSRSSYFISLISFVSFVFLFSPLARGTTDCSFARSAYTQGKKFYERNQFLLATTHFSIGSLAAKDCPSDLIYENKWASVLSMEHLGDRLESGFLIRQFLDEEEEAKAMIEKSPSSKSLSLRFKQNLYILAALMDEQMLPHLDEKNQLKIKLWNSRHQPKTFKEHLAHWDGDLALRNDISILQDSIQNSRNKNPYVSGGLSALLPGSGQAYTGAWQSAGVAFLVNALFLYATYDFNRKHLYGPALASAFIFSITYVGNIINAADTANKINDRDSFLPEKNMKDTLFPQLNLTFKM